MEYNNTIDILINDINEIKSIISGFKNKTSVPQIEFDLALDKLRKLYDVLLMFNQSDNEFNIKEKSKEEKRDTNKDKKIEKSEEISEIPVQIDEIDEEIIPEEDEVEIETIADKFQVSPSRNESMAEKDEKQNVSSRLQSRPIDDIKKAIGINDKFLYTKELFKSNPSLYNQTISALNDAKDFEGVENYLKSNFDWNFEDEVVIDFLEIIKRKFPDS